MNGADLAAISAEMDRSARVSSCPLYINEAEATEVAALALEIVCETLERRGNVLSSEHRGALALMLQDFAGFCSGAVFGRRAYGMPTGMGKTTAAAAFIAALYRLGYATPVSVAASQVRALVAFRQELLDYGVPAGLIGLKHAVAGAGVESTGDTAYRYQLVTHARIRGGTDFELFGEFGKRARPLCIYDETLWRADTASMRIEDVLGALALIQFHTPPPKLSRYFRECEARIAPALKMAHLRPGGRGAPLSLTPIDEDELDAAIGWIEGSRAADKGVAEDLVGLLKLSSSALRVLSTGQGDGVIAVGREISDRLHNVAILDASAPIRELVELDSTVARVGGFDALKSFENVSVSQILSGGGRSSVKAHSVAFAREVAGIVVREAAAEPERCFLIFTFKARDRDDQAGQIRARLADAGLDPAAVNAAGKARFQFLTWGLQEGLNGYEHCETVILAGVLHRSHINLAATIKGQRANPASPTPDSLIRRMLETEVSHCVYQAGSRGSCRRVSDGKAKAMRLHIVHKNEGLKAMLDPVMPGAKWDYPAPIFLKAARETGKVEAMLGSIAEALRALPAGTKQISCRALKDLMGIGRDTATKQRFTAAVKRLDAGVHGWLSSQRALVRAD